MSKTTLITGAGFSFAEAAAIGIAKAGNKVRNVCLKFVEDMLMGAQAAAWKAEI